MSTHDWDGTSEQLWHKAGQFGDLCPAERAGTPDTVLTLSRLREYKPPFAMLAMRFIEGLLAIHQAGAYLALVHPFRNEDDNPQRTIWYGVEQVPCRANQRPFPPLKMKDDRHILFTSATAVYAVNVWSLKDWAYRGDERPRYHNIVDWHADDKPKIVAAPVIIDAQRFGLLTYGPDDKYRWVLRELLTDAKFPEAANAVGDSVELPLEGRPCHVESVADKVLTFATPLGHWVWRFADAKEGKVSELRRTWPRAENDAHLVANAHNSGANNFYFVRQCLTVDRPMSAQGPGKFTWYYQKTGRPNELECYAVSCDSLEPTHVTQLDREHGTIPLGMRVSGPAKALFARGQKLLQEAGLTLESLPGYGLIEDIEQATGLMFQDPLLAAVERGRENFERTLIVRSIHHPNRRTVVDLPSLRSDPLIWSRWLFTIESGDDHALAIRRRDLQASPTTN
jgi:hypothetical protein